MLVASLVVLFAPSTGGVEPFPQADKVVHAVLFLALAVVSRWRFGGRRQVLLAVAVYAAVSELVQLLTLPGRSGDLLDLAVDLLGAAAGWLLARSLTR